MAISCPSWNRCDATFPGWLYGAHPTVAEGIVTRRVCFNRFGTCCKERVDIQVKNCGSYYVYKLVPTHSCPSVTVAATNPIANDLSVTTGYLIIIP